ncbi:hypothetical protein [Streptomyces sp. Ag109_G2-15]|uniref:DUF7919 family protein n=1 Tax=Streptomyces sp. Ag109_G2-15 TaxID=1938850 RepID=UPI000BDA21F7|nr:hypothetical protein [Streptomyces sp. Ag109_G2-15]SOD89098.1 hypothetical protein SAMN06272765_6002 [Streptomyces sp. Ag109_G2-15]
MFYEDLSPYAYWDEGDRFSDVTDGMCFVSLQPAYARLNVGWLGAGRSWSSGPAPQDFTDRLLAVLGAQEANAMLGLHACDLCATPLPDSHPWYVPRPGHLRPSAGTGEIRVPGTQGTAYAVFAFDPYGPWPARFPGIRFPWIPDDAVLRHVDEE